MSKATAISFAERLGQLRCLANRTPTTPSEETEGAFGTLAEYRDGGIFVAHYAGSSEWERHPRGDEIVMVMEGRTTLFLLVDGEQRPNPLGAGELFVVPEDTWHRFESPDGVKVMTVTPQPTDHQATFPESE